MNGAESLVRSLTASGIEVCFSNPGTSEMHFIASLDEVDGMRPILCLFEGVATGVYFITARFGFMETPDVAEALKACRAKGLRVFSEDSSFFVGRHVVRARPLPGLRGLQRRLFARMQQYSTQAAEFFRMPFRDVVILNTAVEI